MAASLEGQALGSFTRISTAVRSAVEAALTRILTPKRSIDILREVRNSVKLASLPRQSWQALCHCCAWTVQGVPAVIVAVIWNIVPASAAPNLHMVAIEKWIGNVRLQVHAARAKGRPYTIVFVGVNGVGKSTNLAKICYWLLQNDVKVRYRCSSSFTCFQT